jgi:hypothetical protein
MTSLTTFAAQQAIRLSKQPTRKSRFSAQTMPESRNKVRSCETNATGEEVCTCAATFRIQEDFHENARKNVLEDKTETGGNTLINYDDFTVRTGSTQGSDQYNGVKLERGAIDWHSHPATCVDGKCALGTPSHVDLGNILLGAMSGGKAHMVYAKEGTYVIQVDPKVVAKYKEDPTLFPDKLKQIVRDVNTVYQKFVKDEISYSQYRRSWNKVAKDHGFLVEFFEPHEFPTIRFSFDCDKTGEHTDRIFVPKELNQHIGKIKV